MRLKSKRCHAAGACNFSFEASNALRHGCHCQKRCHIDNMRHWLAAIFVCSVVAVAIASFFAPKAEEILTKLLPALMLILGYYFGWKR